MTKMEKEIMTSERETEVYQLVINGNSSPNWAAVEERITAKVAEYEKAHDQKRTYACISAGRLKGMEIELFKNYEAIKAQTKNANFALIDAEEVASLSGAVDTHEWGIRLNFEVDGPYEGCILVTLIQLTYSYLPAEINLNEEEA